MAGITAQQKYEEFESIRSRFGAGETRNSGKESGNRPQLQQLSSRRESPSKRRPLSGRSDPRSNAPPLVPLVEEGDQLQEVRNGAWCWRGVGLVLQPADKEGRGWNCKNSLNNIFLTEDFSGQEEMETRQHDKVSPYLPLKMAAIANVDTRLALRLGVDNGLHLSNFCGCGQWTPSFQFWRKICCCGCGSRAHVWRG